jgi:hypothetical protein
MMPEQGVDLAGFWTNLRGDALPSLRKRSAPQALCAPRGSVASFTIMSHT